jgi:diacylglycerol kinase (ATP)
MKNKTIRAFDLGRLWAATRYSYNGLSASFQQEAAFRLEVFLSFIVLPAAWYLGQNGLERGLLITSWLLVPLVELINSAVESVVDRIGPERDALSGRAKDQASAAVLIAVVIAAVTWTAVLL